MARARGVSPGEKLLWRLAMRETVPLPGRSVEVEPPPPPTPPAVPQRAPAVAVEPAAPMPAPRPITLPARAYAAAPGLDRRNAQRLKRGQIPIEARLDLHGMTQEAARRTLDTFIELCWSQGRRHVLVITGKGGRDYDDDPWSGGPGILRRATPRWLNEPPNSARVLAITEAQPQHGGGGALYVLLRRRRE